MISISVAVAKNNVIGNKNTLPWHLPADLARFRKLTLNKSIIMGRKTYESIGKPLPGRTMVVITNQQDYQPDGCLVVHSIADAIDLVETRGETEAFIIGGGEIFKQSLDLADRIYLSTVHTTVHAEVFFPLLDELQWTEIDSSHHPVDQTHQYPFTFTTLIRKTEN